MRRLHVSICRFFLLTLVLVFPAEALGQTTSTNWFVGGLGGVTFGTVTSGAVGGQFGVEVAPNTFVFGEVGRMNNVLPKALRDDLDIAEVLLELEFGLPITLDVSVPATYGMGGVRWIDPRRQIAPFLEAGVGFGHISINVNEASVLGIDLSDEVQDYLGSDQAATKFLLALGGGIGRQVGRLRLEGGYRYTRIATEDPSINSSMVYVSVKVGGERR